MRSDFLLRLIVSVVFCAIATSNAESIVASAASAPTGFQVSWTYGDSGIVSFTVNNVVSYEKVIVSGKSIETISIERDVSESSQNYLLAIDAQSPGATRAAFRGHPCVVIDGTLQRVVPANVMQRLDSQLDITSTSRVNEYAIVVGEGRDFDVVQVASKGRLTAQLIHFVRSFRPTK